MDRKLWQIFPCSGDHENKVYIILLCRGIPQNETIFTVLYTTSIYIYCILYNVCLLVSVQYFLLVPDGQENVNDRIHISLHCSFTYMHSFLVVSSVKNYSKKYKYCKILSGTKFPWKQYCIADPEPPGAARSRPLLDGAGSNYNIMTKILVKNIIFNHGHNGHWLYYEKKGFRQEAWHLLNLETALTYWWLMWNFC